MPYFTANEKSAEWNTSQFPRNNWWERVKNRFQKNIIGQYVTAVFRERIYQPWIVRSFVPSIYTFNLHEESGKFLGKYMRVAKGGTGQKLPTEFIPVEYTFGKSKETALLHDMQERAQGLRDRIAALQSGAASRTGTFLGWNSTNRGDAFKSLDQLQKERLQLIAFIQTYRTHSTAYKARREYYKKGEERGEALGTPDYRTLGEEPELPDLPEAKETEEFEGKRSTKMKRAEFKELKKKGKTMVHFKGRWYALAIGEGTVTQLYQEVIDEAHPVKKFLTDLRDWRAYNRNTTHALPPKALWKFHFNLLQNRFRKGETPKQNYATTMANTQKVLGDEAGRTFLYKIYSESTIKRLRKFGVNYITGKALAEAMKDYSGEFGGTQQKRNIPGYKSDKRYALDSLGPRELTAVHGMAINHSMPGSRFRSGGPKPLSPARWQELNQRETEILQLQASGQSVNDVELRLIQNSFKENKDLVGYATLSSLKIDDMSRVQPWAELAIREDGALTLTESRITNKGDIEMHMKPGWKPFTIQRWDIPTVLAEGHTVMEYLPSYKPFVKMIVDMGKAQDTTMGQLLMEQRQPLKGMIMQYTHDGSLDDGSDMAIKLAAAMGLGPKYANHFYTVLHEQADRWDGAKFDHLRRQVGDFLFTLDETCRAFYFGSASDTEQRMDYRPMLQEERGKFIMKFVNDQYFIDFLYSYEENHKAAQDERLKGRMSKSADESTKHYAAADKREEAAENSMTKMTQKIQMLLGDDISTATHSIEHGFGEIGPPSKRVQKIATWFASQSELLKTFFVKHEMKKVLGSGGSLFTPEWLTEDLSTQNKRMTSAQAANAV